MLPSVRAFAAEQGANPLTVAKAYQQFQTDGLVEVQRGVGMFVARGRGGQAARGPNALTFLARGMAARSARAWQRLGISPADLLERSLKCRCDCPALGQFATIDCASGRRVWQVSLDREAALPSPKSCRRHGSEPTPCAAGKGCDDQIRTAAGLVADNPDLRAEEVEQVVDIFFDEIAARLAEGGRVELRGFGTFSTRQRDARTGRNPRTGESVNVPAKRVPYFKPGKEMRERLNTDERNAPDPTNGAPRGVRPFPFVPGNGARKGRGSCDPRPSLTFRAISCRSCA